MIIIRSFLILIRRTLRALRRRIMTSFENNLKKTIIIVRIIRIFENNHKKF
jgi:hypothetical protein